MYCIQTGWKNVFDVREQCAAACMDNIMDNGGKQRHGVILRFRIQGKMILACKIHECVISDIQSFH